MGIGVSLHVSVFSTPQEALAGTEEEEDDGKDVRHVL